MFILFAERKVGEQHGPAAQGVLAAVQTLREMNADNLRKVPADAPTAFIKPRWKPLVITPEGLDRKFYEICALSELKNALRSGDIWVKGSRQFRDFDDYLLPAEKFAALKREQALPLAINPNSDQYLEERLQLLDEQLATVTRLAKDNELPDAILTESGLKITPLDAAVPDRAQALIDQTSQLYLERATQGLVEAGKPVDGELLQFLSPLGWEHINLTGDYVWRQSRRLEDGKFRPLRMPGKP